MTGSVEKEAAEFREDFDRVLNEIQKVIVGNRPLIEGVLTALFAGGHVLLEGVPGLGKTMLVRTLSEALDLPFGRIQFTPDLMPADIVGTNIVQEDPETGRRQLLFEKGPIFTNLLLADEINRATPKTQSSMLECMQEKQITAAGTLHKLAPPFFVMATQNPIEMEGTYPLPEAQLDRFFFKLMVPFPNRKEMALILDRTTRQDAPVASKVLTQEQILRWMNFIRKVEIAPHVQDYGVRLLLATHPESDYATDMVRRYVRFGSSPRGAQSLILAAKISALRQERYNVAFLDLSSNAVHTFRHRIVLNFEAEAEGISQDQIIKDIVEKVSRDVADFAAT